MHHVLPEEDRPNLDQAKELFMGLLGFSGSSCSRSRMLQSLWSFRVLNHACNKSTRPRGRPCPPFRLHS